MEMEDIAPAYAPAYTLWGKDRVAYGPAGLDALIEWIEEGRVAPDSWVFFEPDNRWRRTAEIPELEAACRSKQQSRSPAVSSHPGSGRQGLDAEALRRVKVFQGLDGRQIASFVHYMEVVTYPQFSHIVRKGDYGDAMYVVIEGELRALTIVDGKESPLTTILAGEAFGEISLLDQGPRSADVIANQDSVLLRISVSAFDRVLREAPALAVPLLLALSRAVVGRVRRLTQRYEDSVHFIRSLRP